MRVTHVLRFDAGLYRGGGEIKAQRTREALQAIGVDVQVYTPLTEELGDLVHFFGSMNYYWAVAEHCLQRGIPYVASPIFVTPRSRRRLRWRAWRQRLAAWRKPSNHQKLLEGAKELFFQTAFERDNALAYYGEKIAKPVIISNGVEARFASGDAAAFRERFGVNKPFVLQAAVFNPNKHQLELIQAMAGSEMDLVLLGRTPNAAYFEACKRTAGPNVHFLGSLPHEDSLLPGAFAAADVFCLASSDDIFANSAMEAAVAGCKLILGNRWGGQEVYGDWAKWVPPGDVGAIRSAIDEWRLGSHDPDEQSSHFLQRYSWEAVARQLKSRYGAWRLGGPG